jgi:hypothetical protein
MGGCRMAIIGKTWTEMSLSERAQYLTDAFGPKPEPLKYRVLIRLYIAFPLVLAVLVWCLAKGVFAQ